MTVGSFIISKGYTSEGVGIGSVVAASAQSSDDGEEIWSSTMTVGSFIISKGYTSQTIASFWGDTLSRYP